MINIGCHLSFSGGFLSMGEDAIALNADTFQFFTRNPRGGRAKELSIDDAKALQKLMTDNQFGKIIAHAPYTLNLCSSNPRTREFAKITMVDDLQRMEYVPNQYYNFHPGSHTGQGVDIAIEQISSALNEIIKSEQTTMILLETMAGKGTEIGRTFEELSEIINRVELNNKLGVCFDTCHVFDSGYDIVNNLDDVLNHFDKIIGLNRLKAVHLNDSKNICGSHKDRHEKIGQGNIGLDAISRIVKHPALQGIPFCLETPNELSGYAEEISLIRNIINESSIKES